MPTLLSERLSGLLSVFRASRGATAQATIRMLPWFAFAQVEDLPEGTFPFPEEERLTAERLQLMARNHKPQLFRPPVLTGADRAQTNVGPSHWFGPYFDPLGFVEELRFDGLTLWGRCSELVVDGVARITDAVARGRVERSIGFHYSDPNPSVEGGFMLMHLALTGGEEPGQRGLPPLTQHLPGVIVAEDATGDAERLVGTMARTLGRDRAAGMLALPTAVRTFNPNSTAAPRGEDQEMDEPTLRRLLEEQDARMRTVMQEQVSTSVETAVSAAVQAAVAPAVQAAVAPLQAQLTAAATEVTSLRTATEAASQAEVERFCRAAVQANVDAFRLQPALAESEVETLIALPEAARTRRLAALSAAPAVVGRSGRTPVVIIGEGDQAVDALSLLPPEAVNDMQNGGPVDPSALRLFGDAVRAAGGLEAIKKNPRALLDAAARLQVSPGWNLPS